VRHNIGEAISEEADQRETHAAAKYADADRHFAQAAAKGENVSKKCLIYRKKLG